jgi:multidrug efflux system membrane fusion protein
VNAPERTGRLDADDAPPDFVNEPAQTGLSRSPLMAEHVAAPPGPIARRRWWLIGVAAALVAIAALVAYLASGTSASGTAKGPAPAPVPVSVVTVAQQSMPMRIAAIGNVEPFATVSVKARVDGQIVDVGFKEGEEVREGQLLFRIDPRPYEAALRQAEATHQRDTAAAAQARSQEKRYLELLEKNFVSKDAYAQFRTNAETAEAVAAASRAAVENARLSVDYCTIRSPINGFAGKTLIQRGNLVKANDTASLIVLNQVRPVYVNFAVPEQNLDAIRTYMARGPLGVSAVPPGSSHQANGGRLVFVDNAVDSTTGTIRLRAQFPNQDLALWPGQYVNVAVTLFEQDAALVVPADSVQNGPQGQYVYVVKPDLTAELRQVKLDRVDGGRAIIAAGLKPGENVVTQGQLRLGPGSKVTIRTKPEAS